MTPTKIIFGTILGITLISAASSNDQPIGDDIANIPIFDAHVHYKEPAWDVYPPSTVIELMDASGVAMALVSSTPDEGTIKLFEYAPDRIVPELRPYHGEYGSGNWINASGMIDYLNKRLEAYPHEGLGEFHVHNVNPDDRDFLAMIADMADQRDIPVHIHSGAEPVRLFFKLQPDLTIIWAHAGMSEPANVVDDMMNTYSALYADTSYREHDILIDWNECRPVIERHADRLMVGTDTWVNSQWRDYEALINLNRQWLAKLPAETAKKIAYKNAETLFSRKIETP